jgi:hypothetical protein
MSDMLLACRRDAKKDFCASCDKLKHIGHQRLS